MKILNIDKTESGYLLVTVKYWWATKIYAITKNLGYYDTYVYKAGGKQVEFELANAMLVYMAKFPYLIGE